LATPQAGLVKRAQLVAEGVGSNVVKRQLRVGSLHRRHRGVYVVGHLALAPLADETAALLACGDRAVISHRSAAHMWSLIARPPADVEVTLVGRRCRPKQGVRLHWVAAIDEQDVRLRGGLLVTSPARTLIDLALEAGYAELERAVAEARARRLLDDGELERALERSRGRRCAARMRRFLRSEGGPALTRSGGERRMRKLLRDAQLPQPVLNATVAGCEVDFLWAAQRLIVELDSYDFHGHRLAFERDRRRDMVLQDAGYQVIRITGRALVYEPLSVVAHIARALDRRARPVHRRVPV
jgi:very-short-patch-repair endonuclease